MIKELGFIENTLWLFFWKIRKDITIINAFPKILDKSGCKPNNIWVYKGNELYNRLMKYSLGHGIEMYSTQNEGRSVAA